MKTFAKPQHRNPEAKNHLFLGSFQWSYMVLPSPFYPVASFNLWFLHPHFGAELILTFCAQVQIHLGASTCMQTCLIFFWWFYILVVLHLCVSTYIVVGSHSVSTRCRYPKIGVEGAKVRRAKWLLQKKFLTMISWKVIFSPRYQIPSFGE